MTSRVKDFIENTPFNLVSRTAFSLVSTYPERRKLARTPDMVFLWIPKAAGTSVFEFLAREVGMQKLKDPHDFLSFPNRGAVTFGHAHYLSLRRANVVTDRYHDRAFKFALIRNPYSRAASLYNYLVRINGLEKDCSFDSFLDRVRLRRPPVGVYNVSGLSQTNPQVDWLIGEDGEIIADRVFRVEEMDQFLSYISDRYAISAGKPELVNTSPSAVRIDGIFARRDRIEKINEIYRRDFRLLGYEEKTGETVS